MRNLLILILNTMKVTFRKKGNIILYLFLPLGGVLLSMLIYNGAGSSVMGVGILDKDRSAVSQDFYSALKASDGYRVSTVEENEINEKLLDKRVNAVVVIPEGYGKSVYDAKPLQMKLISIKGQDTTVWLENYINIYTRNLADLSAASGEDKVAFDKMYEDYKANPLKFTNEKLQDEKTSKMMTVSSLGFLIMFVMLGAGMTSHLILNEKRSRTYFRICSAPVNARTYITANSITSLVIVAFQVILIQIAIKYVFHIETFVPDTMLFLILMVFGTSAVGLSLMVTAFSSSSYMAGTLNTLIITPTCMLGGCYWPLSFMPLPMQKLAYFVPQRWVLQAVEKIQSGEGLEGIVMNLAVLLAFAAAMFAVAAYRFSRASNIQKFV